MKNQNEPLNVTWLPILLFILWLVQSCLEWETWKEKKVDLKIKTEEAVVNGQSRDTGNIGYTRHRTKTNQTNNIAQKTLKVRDRMVVATSRLFPPPIKIKVALNTITLTHKYMQKVGKILPYYIIKHQSWFFRKPILFIIYL